METFHVFVIGSEERTSEGLARVAEAIAAHYGLPADDLLGRLTRGRFRVKTGVDRATAEQYQRDLVKLGARVAIEPAAPTDRSSGSSLPPPVRNSSLPPPNRSSTPMPAARPSTTPPPSPALGAPRTSTPPPVGGLQSGLAAAFSGSNAAADLSAFDNLAGGSLASLDGVADEPPKPTGAFAPPGPAAAAKPGAPGKPGAPAKPPRPRDTPVDMDFAPPDAEEAEMKMEIATDELEHRARKRAPAVQAINTTTTPSAAVPTAPPSAPLPPPASQQSAPRLTPSPTLRPSQPSASAALASSGGAAVAATRSRLGPLSDERVRMHTRRPRPA